MQAHRIRQSSNSVIKNQGQIPLTVVLRAINFKNYTVSSNFIKLAEIRSCFRKHCWSQYITWRSETRIKTILSRNRAASREKMSEPVISGVASHKFPFWIRSGSLGGLRSGRRKKDYASRARTKAPNSRTLRSLLRFVWRHVKPAQRRLTTFQLDFRLWGGSFVENPW